MPLVERCDEKIRLLREYRKAAESYSAAVSELSRKIGIVPIAEYRRLSDFAETSRHHSADASARLVRHIAQHGC